MKCPQCGFENEEGSNFCKYCGVPLSKQDYSEDNPYTKKNRNEDKPSELISDEEVKVKNKIEKEERIPVEVGNEIGKEKEGKKKPSSRTGCLVFLVLAIIVGFFIFKPPIPELCIILAFLFLLMFLLGAINPKWVLLWGKEKTKRKVGIYFGIPFFVFIVLYAILAPSNEQENKTAIVITNAINTENNEDTEKAVFSSDMTEDEFFTLLKKDDLYNECIEISDRVSKYKRNKKWIIETATYLVDKCNKRDMRNGGLGTDLLELNNMKDSYNYSDEMHEQRERRFKGIGGRLIANIYRTILRENLFKFSIFLPINKDNLFDFFTQDQFVYTEDTLGAPWGDYIEKKYSQSKVFNNPKFFVGWDKISGKLVSIKIPLGDNFEYDKIEQKEWHYKNFINAFAKSYDCSIQVIEMFNKDLKDYLYQQMESYKNYNQLKFEENCTGEKRFLFFHQESIFKEYTVSITCLIGSTSMHIITTEKSNVDNIEWELHKKYLMEREMGLK
jgi:hypothetical protein